MKDNSCALANIPYKNKICSVSGSQLLMTYWSLAAPTENLQHDIEPLRMIGV